MMKYVFLAVAAVLLVGALLFAISGCGEARPADKKEYPGVKSWEFRSANNSSYGIDEVEIDGKRYLVLHDGRAVCIIPKTESKPEKEP